MRECDCSSLPRAVAETIDDEQTETGSITVEEYDLNCPQEEMLDLTVKDEFSEEFGRLEL